MLLFDIDGTLIDSQGAGGGALLKAAREEFDLPSIQPVPLHGRTDCGIMSEMLASAGVEPSIENLGRLCQRYFRMLPDELAVRGGRVLPGVRELLGVLVSDPRCHLGLVTGNMPQSAQLKLQHFELWDYFRFGTYGQDAAQRRDLCQPAWETIRQYASAVRGGKSFHGEHVIIIGDTILDVDLALVMQVRCLGVCTGGTQASVLQSAGAHHVAEDLSDTEQIVRWIFSKSHV